MKIVIEMEVKAPLGVVWDAWVAPEDIVQWNFAVDEWCCPRAVSYTHLTLPTKA